MTSFYTRIGWLNLIFSLIVISSSNRRRFYPLFCTSILSSFYFYFLVSILQNKHSTMKGRSLKDQLQILFFFDKENVVTPSLLSLNLKMKNKKRKKEIATKPFWRKNCPWITWTIFLKVDRFFLIFFVQKQNNENKFTRPFPSTK